MLRNRGIDTLLVCGVTTEVCVHTTVREANDRGYRCVVLGRLLRLLFPGIPRGRASTMIKAQGGIFGWVSHSAQAVLARAAHDVAARRQSRSDHRRGSAMTTAAIGDKLGPHCGRRATGTPSSASAPTSSSTCWC